MVLPQVNQEANFTNYEVEDINNDHNSKFGNAINEKGLKLELFRNCILEGCKQMSTTINEKGNMINQKEAYINTVRSATDLFLPDLLKNDKLSKNMVSIENKEKDIKNKFRKDIENLKSESKKPQNINSPQFFQNNYLMLKDELDKELIDLYREKVIVLSFLLDERSFYADNFGEGSFDTVPLDDEPGLAAEPVSEPTP